MTTFTKNTSNIICNNNMTGAVQEEKKFDNCETNTNMNCEIANMYKFLGEKVGNTNLPRNLCQFKIEIEKMCDKIDENKKLKKDADKYFMESCSADIKINKLEEEIEKLKKENEENIKKLNEYEICKKMLMGRIEKQIEDKITYDDQVDIWLPPMGGFYREHYINFIKDVIIPELTTHDRGDCEYSSFKNGYYYYDNDCMNPYELQYNGEGCLLFNRVETSSEEEDESDEEEIEDVEFDDEGTPYVKHIEEFTIDGWIKQNSDDSIDYISDTLQKELKEKFESMSSYDCYMMDCENEAFRNFIAPGQQKRLYDFGMKKRYACEEWMRHLYRYMDTHLETDGFKDLFYYKQWVKQGGGDFWTEC